jgi:hypothetical protein
MPGLEHSGQDAACKSLLPAQINELFTRRLLSDEETAPVIIKREREAHPERLGKGSDRKGSDWSTLVTQMFLLVPLHTLFHLGVHLEPLHLVNGKDALWSFHSKKQPGWPSS